MYNLYSPKCKFYQHEIRKNIYIFFHIFICAFHLILTELVTERSSGIKETDSLAEIGNYDQPDTTAKPTPGKNVVKSQSVSTKGKDVTPPGSKSFSCSDCDKVFQLKTSLQRHRRLHTGNMFPCAHCASLFLEKSSLKRHVDNVHLKIKYTCSGCTKNFARKRSLTKFGGQYLCSRCVRSNGNMDKTPTASAGSADPAPSSPECVCIICGATYDEQAALCEHELNEHKTSFFKLLTAKNENVVNCKPGD